jgi:hypothetical protein
MHRQPSATTALVLSLLLFPFAAHAQAPIPLVPSGAFHVAYSPDLTTDPGTFWYTQPTCDGLGAAGNELSPALITRAATYGAAPRLLMRFNPPRPVATCNPYRLMSNIAADGGFIYFVDKLTRNLRQRLPCVLVPHARRARFAEETRPHALDREDEQRRQPGAFGGRSASDPYEAGARREPWAASPRWLSVSTCREAARISMDASIPGCHSQARSLSPQPVAQRGSPSPIGRSHLAVTHDRIVGIGPIEET